MGIENAWSLEEDLSGPPTSGIDMTSYGDTALDNGPFSEDIDCLFSPMDQSTETQEDTLMEAGVCGLRNLGYTCFMSAGIQCLVATAPLVKALLQLSTPQPPPHNSLTLELVDLTRKIWSGQYSSLHPMHFKAALAAHYPQFNDYGQHDSQEFLALLLDALHEQMNTAVNKTSQLDLRSTPFYKEASTSRTNFNESTSGQVKIVDKNMREEEEECERCNIAKVSMRLNNMESSVCGGGRSLSLLNNTFGPQLSGLDDILKEAKTSDLNVLTAHQPANNIIKFDSDKYPRIDNIRRKENFSLNKLNSVNGAKRCKKTATEYNCETEGLDLKRVKLSDEEETTGIEKNKRMELERKMRLLDKNSRMEYERKQDLDTGGGGGEERECDKRLEEEPIEERSREEAEKHWQQHLDSNRSVIVDTFQGQFRSTVVCSVCEFVSVTYEPFMYLSVPLPNALKKQIRVIYVNGSGTEVTELVVEIGRHETYMKIATIRQQVMNLVGNEGAPVVMAQVLNHHIAKILDDSCLVRDSCDDSRSLYAFEIISLNEELATLEELKESDAEMVERCCTICLEDKETDMKQHVNCTCVLCDICITASCEHHGDNSLQCPVCRKLVNPECDLEAIEPSSLVSVRMILVPVVYRVDKEGDDNSNRKSVELFGHPSVVRLPNRCSGQLLHSTFSSLVPYLPPFKLLLVDGQGTHCSRCMYHSHCRGCPVSDEGMLVLRSSDTLAVTFSTLPIYRHTVMSHPSLSALRPHVPLTLYDCIHAFSQSECLDEQNPWYCPRCLKNQCATKTLSIWRHPDYLIVYLKRFIFHDRMSTKLEDKVIFPISGLNLASHVPLYDLYACVCHSGGVSGGHYTTYTQHPITGEWHHYNDSNVTKQPPQEEDFSNAYILFYKKQGVRVPSLEHELEPQRND